MKLEDVADIHIGVVLKRKEAVYKGNKTNKYKSYKNKACIFIIKACIYSL